MKKFVFVTGLALFLHSCSYAISPEFTSQADQTLSLALIQQEPAVHAGKLAILGGIIIAITNTDHGTLLEVEQRPLDYWGRPLRTKRTDGRFLLLHPALLNAFLYAPGREITAAAEVAEASSPALENSNARYPTLRSKELKLWREEKSAATSPRWLDPLYDPYGSMRTQ